MHTGDNLTNQRIFVYEFSILNVPFLWKNIVGNMHFLHSKSRKKCPQKIEIGKQTKHYG